jgi:hypothetical protein
MTITIEFDIGNTVWFIHNNQITSGEIKDVCACATSENINYLILPNGEEVGISKFENELFATEEEVRGCDPI